MISVFSYKNKKIETLRIENVKKMKPSDRLKNKLWIVVEDANKEDAKILKQKFNLHPTTINDMFSIQTRVKYEEMENYTLIVLKTIKKVGSIYIKTDNLSMVFGEDILITCSPGANKTIGNLINTNGSKLESLFSKGEDFICHYILDREINKYADLKNYLGEEFKQLEREFLTTNEKEVLRKLFTKELLILELRHLTESITDLTLNLIKPTNNYVQNELIPYMRDLYDHSLKTEDSLRALLERINGMRNSYQSLQANKLNETIRTLTILTALLLPMTVITGFYGMNVKLPFQNHQDIAILIASVMILTSAVIYLIGKRLGWIKGVER